MATLSLPGLTIGFPVWLFSTSLVQNVVISPQSSTPPTGQNQPIVDPKVDALPSSSAVSSSPSSSSLGESIGTSNQVAKKKKKKQIQQRGNQATIALNANLMRNRSLSLRNIDIHANFVQETIFFEIALIFLRS